MRGIMRAALEADFDWPNVIHSAPLTVNTELEWILCLIYTHTIDLKICHDIFQNSFSERLDSVSSHELCFGLHRDPWIQL